MNTLTANTADATGKPSNPSGSTPLRAWLAVISVTLGAFAFVTTEFLPVGLLVQIAQDLNISPGTAGLMVTTPGLIAAIAAPAMMLGAGRIDRRLILLGLSVLLLASNLVSALAPGFATMLVGRALLGLSLGGFWTLALAAAGRLVRPQDAGRATAMIFAGVTFATVIGVPLGTFISTLWSWRAAFVANGILAALALAAQAFLLPALPSKTGLKVRDFTSLLARALPRKSVLMVGLLFSGHLAAYTYIAPFLAHNASFSLPAITPMLLGFGIAGFIANFAVSGYVERHLQGLLITAVAVLMGSLLALPLLQDSTAGVVLLVMAWGLAFGTIPLCLSLWMQQSSPAQPEAGSALFVSTVQLAIATGSFAGGVVADRLGIPASLWLGSALGFAGLLVVASFGLGHRNLGAVLAGGKTAAC